jgi:hypothetical protein
VPKDCQLTAIPPPARRLPTDRRPRHPSTTLAGSESSVSPARLVSLAPNDEN